MTALFSAKAESGGEKDSLILSETTDTFTDDPIFQVGNGTYHGNNQTRLCVTESGIYISTPLGEKPNTHRDLSDYDQLTETGLWRVNPDRSVTLLFTDFFFGVEGGATTYVFADGEGNIWVTCSWEEMNRMHLNAWCWNVKEEKAEKYYEAKYIGRGNNYTKAGAVMDVKFNRIYAYCIGGDYSPGHVLWYVFDINTKTWGDYHYKKIAGGCTYHFGFADGKGGFFTVCQKAHSISHGPSDIDGLTQRQAHEIYHSSKHIPPGANEMWIDPHLIYIPNADENVAYDTALYNLLPTVKEGLYPQDTTSKREVYWDTDAGKLYVLTTVDDANGKIGLRELVSVYDTTVVNENIEEDGVFPLISRKEYTFLYGWGEDYHKRVVKDSTGQLYLVAIPWMRGAVEIYSLDNPEDPEIRFLYTEDLRGYATGFVHIWGEVVANERNNSIVGKDEIDVIACSWDDGHWFYFTIDFALLREKLGR